MYKHDVYKFQFRTCSRSKYLRFIHCLWIHTVNFNKVNFCKPQLNCKKKKKNTLYVPHVSNKCIDVLLKHIMIYYTLYSIEENSNVYNTIFEF